MTTKNNLQTKSVVNVNLALLGVWEEKYQAWSEETLSDTHIIEDVDDIASSMLEDDINLNDWADVSTIRERCHGYLLDAVEAEFPSYKVARVKGLLEASLGAKATSGVKVESNGQTYGVNIYYDEAYYDALVDAFGREDSDLDPYALTVFALLDGRDECEEAFGAERSESAWAFVGDEYAEVIEEIQRQSESEE